MRLWQAGSYGQNAVTKGPPCVVHGLHPALAEPYYLTLLEAVYLKRHCAWLLEVLDAQGCLLSTDQLLQRLPSQHGTVLWTAYVALKGAGWIVKEGAKYGVDFLLYREAPGKAHASHAVLIQHPALPPLSWTQLVATCRVLDQVKKKLLLMRIVGDASHTTQLSRWMPQRHRE